MRGKGGGWLFFGGIAVVQLFLPWSTCRCWPATLSLFLWMLWFTTGRDSTEYSGRSYLTVTVSQAQHFLVSSQQILTQHYLISTLLHSTMLVLYTTHIQQATLQYTLYSTNLAFNNSCMEHYVISTIMDSTIPVSTHLEFNNPCFKQAWVQQSLFSTHLGFNNSWLHSTVGQLRTVA